MLPDIINFKKTLNDRIEEYETLLGEVDTRCSEVRDVWANIFEDFVALGVGWQAVWMISERNCRKYDVLHPTAVIVYVNECNCHELEAIVSVVAVQEDILLPSIVNVPFIELHPFKDQDYNEADLHVIADWLEKCRFFFQILWYPWDAKVNVTLSEWCKNHLKNRLQLQYELLSGTLDMSIGHYVKSLVNEAQELEEILDKISSDKMSEEDRLMLINCYKRRKVIKLELDLFEEPDLKYASTLMKKRNRQMDCSAKSKTGDTVLVCPGCTFEDFVKHMESAKSFIDMKTMIKLASNIQDVLEHYVQGDLILLSPGIHEMKSLMNFESGGTMKGLHSPEDTYVTEDPTRVKKAILFEAFGPVILENLTISRPDGICVQLFLSSIKLSHCNLESKGSPTSKGIVIISGCWLELDHSKLSGFGTGIILQKGACAVISNTCILNCYEGIKINDDAQISLLNVRIHNCATYGIRLESTTFDAPTPLAGDLNLLTEGVIPGCKVLCQGVDIGETRKAKVYVSKAASKFVIENNSDFDDLPHHPPEDEDFADTVEDLRVKMSSTIVTPEKHDAATCLGLSHPPPRESERMSNRRVTGEVMELQKPRATQEVTLSDDEF